MEEFSKELNALVRTFIWLDTWTIRPHIHFEFCFRGRRIITNLVWHWTQSQSTQAPSKFDHFLEWSSAGAASNYPDHNQRRVHHIRVWRAEIHLNYKYWYHRKSSGIWKRMIRKIYWRYTIKQNRARIDYWDACTLRRRMALRNATNEYNLFVCVLAQAMYRSQMIGIRTL